MCNSVEIDQNGSVSTETQLRGVRNEPVQSCPAEGPQRVQGKVLRYLVVLLEQMAVRYARVILHVMLTTTLLL